MRREFIYKMLIATVLIAVAFIVYKDIEFKAVLLKDVNVYEHVDIVLAVMVEFAIWILYLVVTASMIIVALEEILDIDC